MTHRTTRQSSHHAAAVRAHRGWVEYGDPYGVPVLYFHGTPGSRLEAKILAPDAARAGVRLISMDRPGFGHTRHRPDRRLEDWPMRVLDLVEEAGVSRFGVLGWSGGAPYVVACLAAIPAYLSCAALIAPAGPGDGTPASGRVVSAGRRVLAGLAGLPGLSALVRSGAALAHRVPGLRRVVPTPRVAHILVEGIQHALSPGAAGWAHDFRVIDQDWGAMITAARNEVDHRAAAGNPLPITVWHGSRDRVVSFAGGRQLAAELGARFVADPVTGHLGVLTRNTADIAAFLAGKA